MHLPFSRPACGPLSSAVEDRGPQAGRLNGEKVALLYGPPLPIHRRPVVLRRASVALSVVLAIVVCRLWGPAAWLRARLLHYQRQCLSHAAPGGTVVADYRGKTPVGVVPAEWAAFYGLLSSPGFRSDGTLFLHERSDPAGERRLVAIDLTCEYGPTFVYQVKYICRVFVPGNGFRSPAEVLARSDRHALGTFPTDCPGPYVEAGVPDTADPTHFTFAVTFDGIDGSKRVTYDGWLRDDDSVSIEPSRRSH